MVTSKYSPPKLFTFYTTGSQERHNFTARHKLPIFSIQYIEIYIHTYICRGGQNRDHESLKISMPRHATQSQSHHMTSSKRKWHHGFNLQLWELDPMTDVCGEGVSLLQRKGTSHCDWPCQVARLVGSAKRRKETVGFSFPLDKSKHPFPYSFHTFTYCRQTSQIRLLPWRQERNNWQLKQN